MSVVVPNLSVTYLKSAAKLAKKIHKIEIITKRLHCNSNLDYKNIKTNNKKICQLADKTQCYSIASIIHAWMFMEAYIDEFFWRVQFEYNNQISSSFAIFWKPYIEENDLSKSKPDIKEILKAKTLDKYQRALNESDNPLFDKGREPDQSIQHLRKLRNAMVHYKPEAWADDIETSKKLFSDKLENSGLNTKIKSLKPFNEGTKNPFFSDKCFGYSCAKWAFKSSVNFIEEFSTTIELKVFPEWFEKAKKLP